MASVFTGYHAQQCKGVSACVSELMPLASGYEHHIAFLEHFLIITVNNGTLAAQDEYLVLPGMCVQRGMAVRLYFEVSHHKVICAPVLVYHPANPDAPGAFNNRLGGEVSEIRYEHEPPPFLHIQLLKVSRNLI